MRSWLYTLGGPRTVRGTVTTGWKDAEVSKWAFRDRRWMRQGKPKVEVRKWEEKEADRNWRKRERGSKRNGENALCPEWNVSCWATNWGKKKLFKAPQCSDGIYIAMRKPPKKMPLLQNSPGETNNSYHHVSILCMRSRRQYASTFFLFPASKIKL